MSLCLAPSPYSRPVRASICGISSTLPTPTSWDHAGRPPRLPDAPTPRPQRPRRLQPCSPSHAQVPPQRRSRVTPDELRALPKAWSSSCFRVHRSWKSSHAGNLPSHTSSPRSAVCARVCVRAHTLTHVYICVQRASSTTAGLQDVMRARPLPAAPLLSQQPIPLSSHAQGKSY